MKTHRPFYNYLRKLAALVATLFFILVVLLPPLFGLFARQIIVARINNWQPLLADFNMHSLSADTTAAGWFSSQISIQASGPLLSADGQTSVTREGLLYINHGPVLWHLSDSLLAVAAMQLQPIAQDTGMDEHFSGSAIMRLAPPLHITVSAVAGLQAAGGQHWLELRTATPLLPLAGAAQSRLWLDLDINALHAAGLADQVTVWQQTEHARVSNDRLMFSPGPQ